MTQRICTICFKSFILNSGRQETCSKECRRVRKTNLSVLYRPIKNENRNKRYNQNKEQGRKQKRDAYHFWRTKHPELDKMKNQKCVVCKVLFNKKSGKQKCCSAVCRNEWKKVCHRLRTYKISQEQVLHILNEQKHLCALCYKQLNEDINIDHDHETEEVRGILCSACNIRLGFFEGFKKDTNWSSKAEEYLKIKI